MATLALPPHTASASFLPDPSPCSLLLSPEPGLQRRLVHPSGKWPVHPAEEKEQAGIHQCKTQNSTRTEPQNDLFCPSLERYMQGPLKRALKSYDWTSGLKKQSREGIFFTVTLWQRGREKPVIQISVPSNGIPARRLGNNIGSVAPSHHMILMSQALQGLPAADL